jgi:ribosomal protein L12E/L44/L45/RPP1/RPP2
MKTAEEMYNYCVDNNYGQGTLKKWGIKHFGVIAQNLMPDETVLMTFIGLYNVKGLTENDGNFAFAVTTKRLICAQKHLVGETLATVAIDKINDVTVKTGLVLGTITIDSLHEIIEVTVNKLEARSISERLHSVIIQAKSMASSPTAPPSSTAPAQPTNIVQQLKELKELVDMGILTEEEFSAKKKQLLGI